MDAFDALGHHESFAFKVILLALVIMGLVLFAF